MIERDCSLVVCGKRFVSGGAVVTETHLRAYPGAAGVLNDWHGRPIGTWRTINSRPAVFFGHASPMAARYLYMRATVDGKEYSLRGFGTGMVATGRAVKRVR